MRRIGKIIGLVVAVLMPAAAHGQAPAPRWQVGSAPSFSSGSYGSDSTTEILYTAFTARRLFTDGDLTLVLPMTCIRGDGSVTVVGGTPIQTRQTDTAARMTERQVTRNGVTAPETPATTTATAVRTSTCGVGDVIVRARYYVVDEHGWVPTVAIRTHLKVPTASADRGLGTGRPDEGLGVEISRGLGGGLVALVDAGYTFIGRTPELPLDNRWWYDIGLSQRLGGGGDVSAFFEEHGAIVPGNATARDVLLVVSVTAPGGWRWQLSGEFGLSDGAPDRGFTLGASRRF